MCGVHDRGPLRHLDLLVDEDRPARFEISHHMDVVDDLPPDVHRRAVVLERELDRLHGTFDARAVPARRGEEDAFHHEREGTSARRGRERGRL